MTSVCIRVEGLDQVGEARRAAAVVAADAGFDATAAGKLAIVVTECASNLWKHAGGGEVVLTPIDGGIDVLSLDHGPGMANVELCFQDGYSTSGSLGTGLGAVRRLAASHDVYTFPEKGTALLARVMKDGAPAATRSIGGVSVPIRGESMCGDDFAALDSPDGAVILVVDGLGHGPMAADCASAAVETFRADGGSASPPDLMRDVHGALRATRGAAVAIGKLDWRRGELQYCGIGNIAGMIWDHGLSRHLLSHPGIVGHDVRNVRDFTYPLARNVLVLLCSDGVSTHWSLEAYPGLYRHDPALIAGVIYRDHRRGRDDATVLVARGPDVS